jgi:hypothetical protein
MGVRPGTSPGVVSRLANAVALRRSLGRPPRRGDAAARAADAGAAAGGRRRRSYVHEVLQQGAGVEVGEVQSLRQLLAAAPQADVGFWRAWYFGNIPWQRETVTPASVLNTPGRKPVFDGVAR